MANPQIENGYIRIANELWDEILRRDFSKRQQNIILLLWRLSYGCGQKDCHVPKFNVFEIAGIYKGDIKKELKYLRSCRVIEWDEDEMIFSINKNYEVWQVSPGKNWDDEKLKTVVSSNLKRKKSVSKTLTKEQEKVSEILTETETLHDTKVSKTLTKRRLKVSKTLTMKLVKHELQHASNPCGSKGEEGSKYIIKYIIKDSNKQQQLQQPRVAESSSYQLYQNNIRAVPSEPEHDQLIKWITSLGDPFVYKAIEECCKSAKDRPTFRFLEYLINNWISNGARTPEDIERLQSKYRSEKENKAGGGNRARNRESPPGDFDKSEYYSL